mmetsp:Transcript_25642/g.37889  ORF Transcript_25642/g.37889 Transcript_25642/m.37889 type:complete len:411 (+) Transcript_25642:211-1443(+)
MIQSREMNDKKKSNWLQEFQAICGDPQGQYISTPELSDLDDGKDSNKARSLCGLIGTSHDSKYWLALDFSGWTGVSISYAVHFFYVYGVYYHLLEENAANRILFVGAHLPVTILSLISLWKCTMTDPGAVPRGARPLSCSIKTQQQRCPQCDNQYKPPRAHHDSTTGRCIVKLYHFCPWVNASVGALNHKFFCLFCFYTALSCMVGMAMIALRLVQCGVRASGNGNLECCESVHSSPWTMFCLTLVGIVFLIFTVYMMYDQMEAFQTGKSRIARLKTCPREHQSTQEQEELEQQYCPVTQDFNEIFGGSSMTPAWHWLLPLTVTFPPGMKQVVLGFECDDNDDTSFLAQKPKLAYEEIELPDLEGFEGCRSRDSNTGEHHDTLRSNLMAADVLRRKQPSATVTKSSSKRG